jgi:hypothetical protein
MQSVTDIYSDCRSFFKKYLMPSFCDTPTLSLLARPLLEKGEHLCQESLIVSHCLSTCASIASVCGSQKVIFMVR